MVQITTVLKSTRYALFGKLVKYSRIQFTNHFETVSNTYRLRIVSSCGYNIFISPLGAELLFNS